ncbi:MAG: ZIP family metal transporter [Promethearchaeota archaeon]
MDWTLILIGTLASLGAGLATGLGAVPVFFKKNISEKKLDMLLGFASGVMLAASAFSLLVPALNLNPEEGGAPHFNSVMIQDIWTVLIVVLGVIIGAVFLDFIDKWAPHEHFVKGPEGKFTKKLAAIWLFIIAITIHNFPEGLAVGVSFSGGETSKIASGLVVAIAIGLQNIPEGTAVAMPLVQEGYSQKKSFIIATFTGLVEPVGAFIGVALVNITKFFLGFGMAFAAGAMIFVVVDEIIPETQGKEHSRQVTFGVILGFVLMMFLDNFIEPVIASLL